MKPTDTPWRSRAARSAGRGLGALATLALCGAAAAQADATRQRPPPDLACPRDQLTLYAGQVQRYQRGAGRTRLVIRTDWATTETVTLAHPGSDDPARWFLIGGQPFTAADWPRIEARRGRLLAGVRAAAWVCDDGRNATVDWTPPPAK